MPRRKIPKDDAITINRVVFDKTDALEHDCARFLQRAEPRRQLARIKRLLLLGYTAHRERLRNTNQTAAASATATEKE